MSFSVMSCLLDTSFVSVTSSASMLRMESEGGTKFYHLVGEVCVFLCNVVSPRHIICVGHLICINAENGE